MSIPGVDILFAKVMTGEASAAEREECLALLGRGENNEEARRLMMYWLENAEVVNVQSEESAHRIFQSIVEVDRRDVPVKVVHRVHFLKAAWFRWAAAIVLTVGIGTYLFIHTSQSRKEVVFDQPSPVFNEVLPGSDKAILTLSDGRKVELNSAAAETIHDRGLDIKNKGGGLLYANSNIAAINTMTTPKGGQYQLTLSDGTRAWLNAASSITYPTSFTGNTREVSITGEAYFEVKRDKTKPFIVKTNTDEIVVVGTSFNVNNYADEPSSKISLIDGAIKISGNILRPGQAFTGGKIINTNIAQDIAWKNGLFDFTEKNISDIARQIAKWYNVDVVFDGPVSDIKLYGKADRNLSLNGLINGLEGEIAHFELKGRVLHIRALQ